VDEDVVIIALANTHAYPAWKVSEALARVVFGYDYNLPQEPESMELAAESTETWGLPDSLTGKRSSALLSALDNQDLEKIKKLLKENLASDFLEEFSLEGHLDQFQKIQKEIGKFELVEALTLISKLW
jgi:hypothetical protein